jgi:hypothetical protein
MLAACALALAGSAGAQGAMPDQSGPSAGTPAEPGAGQRPDAPKKKTPPASGKSEKSDAIVTPPATGTEEMVKRPQNVDPAISGKTGQIDREKQKEIEGKTEGAAKGMPEYK